MMWSLFIAVVSLGHFPETFARSLVPSVVMVPLVAFRLNQNNERELTHDSAVNFVSRFFSAKIIFLFKNFTAYNGLLNLWRLIFYRFLMTKIVFIGG